jgi:putative flippase GtrA
MSSLLSKLYQSLSGEALRFIIVGVGATALHYGVYLILNLWMNENFAYVIGYLVSLVANYYCSNYFTFKTKPTVGNSVGFVASHGVNLLVHILLLNLFLYLGSPAELAPIGVFVIAVPLNFVLVRLALKGRSKRSKDEEIE